MGKALYRTYRSKKLSEIVGQEHITTALSNALKNGTISHAYLFTGPRGVGKTSIARILAHEINALPYADAGEHLDIIEIDAASNRRIDEIRDLRDKVHIAPTSAKYKVYIIDEVHMLTKEAFNALLKTLEEPPAHVVFILATTEAHKLPETIVSRTQRYTFKPVDKQKVINHLKAIAKKESIDIDEPALELIAVHGQGSFRDSISLLDQVRNNGKKVELTDVEELLGVAPEELFQTIITALGSGDGIGVASSLLSIKNQGLSASQIAVQLGSRLRQQLLAGNAPIGHEQLIKLLDALVKVPAALDPFVALEIALLDAALSDKPAIQKVSTSAEAITMSHISKRPSEVMREAAVAEQPITTSEPEPASAPTNDQTPLSDIDEGTWNMILGGLRRTHATLHSLVRGAEAQFGTSSITLVFDKTFPYKQINSSKNKEIICQVAKEVTGMTPQLICELRDQNDSISTISNIFGGAELLES